MTCWSTWLIAKTQFRRCSQSICSLTGKTVANLIDAISLLVNYYGVNPVCLLPVPTVLARTPHHNRIADMG